MAVDMKEPINKEKKMDKVNTLGKMEAFIMEIGLIIKLPAMGSMFGQMAEHTKEIGLIIKCTVEGNTHGKMVVNIKANINLTKNMASELILGKMAEDI
jgi:hypothetical protein